MNKGKKKKQRSKTIKQSFTGHRLTGFSGINPINKYFKKIKLAKKLKRIFPTFIENALQFTNEQLMLLMVYASLCKVHRVSRIETFSTDPLIKSILCLKGKVSDSTLSGRIEKLGERGSRQLEGFALKENMGFLSRQTLSELTIDMDSTVSMTYGNQEGAEKGFNHEKKGAKSYHPLLAFITEYKMVMHTWFRPGNTYTSNGSEQFVRQIMAHIPKNIEKLFFRMDSGFFDNELLSEIEQSGHDYLVKVKFKGLKELLAIQDWQAVAGHPEMSICEFTRSFKIIDEQGKKIPVERTLKAVRIQTISSKGYMGEDIVGYDYFCYCSSLDKCNALDLHNLYKPRAESENWIEQVKNQLLAGKTLVDNFWANDIFWQLCVLAYNLSIKMRIKVKKIWREEYNTFREWFIRVPGLLVETGRTIYLKIYSNYYYRDRWEKFDLALNE
jgi:hypothetical protein